eukprot:3132558-Amphidinium_carterae.1
MLARATTFPQSPGDERQSHPWAPAQMGIKEDNSRACHGRETDITPRGSFTCDTDGRFSSVFDIVAVDDEAATWI